jgi:hypothetical protein
VNVFLPRHFKQPSISTTFFTVSRVRKQKTVTHTLENRHPRRNNPTLMTQSADMDFKAAVTSVQECKGKYV